MIRDGKTAGWLTLPPEAVLPWARLNNIEFNHTVPGSVVGSGGALLAKEDITANAQGQHQQKLLTVPRDLILSVERVQEHAKVDQDYREVLESIGEFGQRNLYGGSTPRGAILTFLLVQASISCPHLPERVGVHCAFTDYIKLLPLELLPTFWTAPELALLVGTTLAPAIASKLRSLQREYDLIYDSIVTTRWYRAVARHFAFDDWLQVDAMYRSRALDFPDIGHCMVPGVDLANHSAGESTTAIYEKDDEGNAVLLLRDGKTVKEGEEVTITYGDEKGACEMLFSYGFLETDRKSAEMMFLSLNLAEDDLYRSAKMRIADCAPGVKLIDTGDGEVDWTGGFIWLLCVNHDDGLRFEVARTVDGEGEEMHAFFDGKELDGGAAGLLALLRQSPLWDVYRLRAVALLQQRVYEQRIVLLRTEGEVEGTPHGEGTAVRERPFVQAMLLRRLEGELLERAYEDFERQKVELAQSDVVKQYLARIVAAGTGDGPQTNGHDGSGVKAEAEEDFS